jgi:hypothetical protein
MGPKESTCCNDLKAGRPGWMDRQVDGIKGRNEREKKTEALKVWSTEKKIECRE